MVAGAQLTPKGPGARPGRGLLRWFFLSVALPFFLVFPYMGFINNPNENTRTYLTLALVEHHTFALDGEVERFGWTNDMARVPAKNGVPAHNAAVKAPANAFMGVPVYWAFLQVQKALGHAPPTKFSPPSYRAEWFRAATWALRLFSVQLPCFLFLVWFERYLRAFSLDPSLRLAAVAACGLGTNYLAYSLMFVSHALFAVAAFLGFGLTEQSLREEPDPNRRSARVAFAAGFCTAWVTALEYHGFFLSVVLTVFGFVVFRKPSRLLAFCGGAAIWVALVMFFQWGSFGNPFTPGHKMVENAQWAEEHARGLYGVVLPSPEAAFSLAFDPGYGLLGMCPFFYAAFLSPWARRVDPWDDARRIRVYRWSLGVLVAAMVALWVAMCGAIEWRGGWGIGPRRAGAAPPFFALAALWSFEAVARRWPRWRGVLGAVAGGTALVGVVSAGLVALVFNTLPEGYQRPITEFAWPLIRLEFFPHLISEWWGSSSTGLWYWAAAGLLLPAVLAGVAAGPEKGLQLGARTLVFVVAFALAAVPTVRVADPKRTTESFEFWVRGWEPAGRDRLSKWRIEARKAGPTGCAWHRLADAERTLALPEAELDAARARVPRDQCPKTSVFP